MSKLNCSNCKYYDFNAGEGVDWCKLNHEETGICGNCDREFEDLEEATTHYDALVEENNTFLIENSKMAGEIKDLQKQLADKDKYIDKLKQIINTIQQNTISASVDDVNLIHELENQLAEKDQQIAELEEQLKNAIVPKFKVGQEIWETTPLMSWKVKRIECHKFNGGNGDVIMEIYRLGHDVTDDYNCCIMPVDNDRFFATKEEALSRLEELKKENKR